MKELASGTTRVYQPIPNFDLACQSAWRQATAHVVKEDGNSHIPGWERTNSWVQVEFDRLTFTDVYVYYFTWRALKNDEDKEYF